VQGADLDERRRRSEHCILSFVVQETDLDKIGDAFAQGGQAFVEDLSSNPVADAVNDAAASTKAQIDKLTGQAPPPETDKGNQRP